MANSWLKSFSFEQKRITCLQKLDELYGKNHTNYLQINLWKWIMNVQDKKWVVSLPYERGLQLVVFRKPNYVITLSLLKYNTAAKFQVY